MRSLKEASFISATAVTKSRLVSLGAIQSIHLPAASGIFILLYPLLLAARSDKQSG